MPSSRPRLGLTLHNRGVVTGATTIPELLDLADSAEATGWDSVWVGDSILAKPRLDALVLLGALAARTRRLRLGAACMASTPLRQPLVLAYQWAGLDVLSGGRMVFVACPGQPGASSGDFGREFEIFGVDPRSRRGRMEETVEILRLTSAQEHVSFRGTYYQLDDVTLLPRPIQQPLPVWIVASPDLSRPRNVESALRRVARLGDGWMTTLASPDDIRACLELIWGYARELGRPLPPSFEVCLYHSINVNDDRQTAFEESERFLDDYYGASFSPEYVERRVALGPPAACVEHLRRFFEAGVDTITLRITGLDQRRQFRRVTEEVLPGLASSTSGRVPGKGGL